MNIFQLLLIKPTSLSIMKKNIFCLAIVLLSFIGKAQPVFDLFQIQYKAMPVSSVYKGGDEGRPALEYFQTQLNFPLPIGKKNIMVINPQYEYRKIDFEKKDPAIVELRPFHNLQLQSISMTISDQYTFTDTTIQLILATAWRHYAETGINIGNNTMSPAFAVIYGKRTGERFAWQLGGYYSKEFFGDQWLPLIGFDWHPGDRFWCWGLLPRYADFDYRISPFWHTAIAYEGVTDSYRTNEKGWFSILEGQLRWANDFYIPHTPLVLTLEAGHSASREFTAWQSASSLESTVHPAEGFIFRAALTFRFITDKKFITPATVAVK